MRTEVHPIGASVDKSKARRADPKIVSADAFLRSLAVPRYLVRPVLAGGYLYALTSPTNHGKTAVTHLLAVCVALKRAFAGLRVSGGRVLILCGENPDDSKARILGLAQHLGVSRADLDKMLFVRPGADRLALVRDSVISEANAIGEFALVIGDTAAAFFSYDDENDNVQARQAAADWRGLTAIRGNPAVVVNCHPTKSATRDTLLPRGGGGFLGEIDTNLTLWFDGEVATLHHGKIRGPGFEPLSFRFDVVDLEEVADADGLPVRTVVAVPLSDHEEMELGKRRNEDENKLLYAILHFPSHSMADWAKDCGWTTAKGEPQKSKVHRTMERIAADQLAKKYRGRWVLTASGRKEAEGIK